MPAAVGLTEKHTKSAWKAHTPPRSVHFVASSSVQVTVVSRSFEHAPLSEAALHARDAAGKRRDTLCRCSHTPSLPCCWRTRLESACSVRSWRRSSTWRNIQSRDRLHCRRTRRRQRRRRQPARHLPGTASRCARATGVGTARARVRTTGTRVRTTGTCSRRARVRSSAAVCSTGLCRASLARRIACTAHSTFGMSRAGAAVGVRSTRVTCPGHTHTVRRRCGEQAIRVAAATRRKAPSSKGAPRTHRVRMRVMTRPHQPKLK